MLGSLILYLKGMRRMMFQLSGFYYNYFLSPPTLQESGKSMRPWLAMEGREQSLSPNGSKCLV